MHVCSVYDQSACQQVRLGRQGGHHYTVEQFNQQAGHENVSPVYVLVPHCLKPQVRGRQKYYMQI